MDDFPVKSMDENPEFSAVILEQSRPDMDLEALQDETRVAARSLCEEYALDALVMECTDLSTFAASIQATVNVPVYDINSLVEYAAYSIRRKPYPRSGY
jgi:Asp/Glu/hydantoin racemase